MAAHKILENFDIYIPEVPEFFGHIHSANTLQIIHYSRIFL